MRHIILAAAIAAFAAVSTYGQTLPYQNKTYLQKSAQTIF